MMTQKQFDSLRRGDIVQHTVSGDSYVIETHYKFPRGYKGHVGVRTIDISNPREWKLIDPATGAEKRENQNVS